jgi:multisubunit Na+/H+ antiporter MnhB subunit
VPEEGESWLKKAWPAAAREWEEQAKAYAPPWTTIVRYWQSYGGRATLTRSPYLHVAMAAAVVCCIWPPTTSWHERAIEIAPSMLGLTLASYAILLATGTGSFQTAVAKAGGERNSVLGGMNSAFLHFMVVQVVTLFAALLGSALREPVSEWISRVFIDQPDQILSPAAVIRTGLRFVGWTLVFYSVTCGLASAFRIFRYVGWFVKSVHAEQQADAEEPEDAAGGEPSAEAAPGKSPTESIGPTAP